MSEDTSPHVSDVSLAERFLAPPLAALRPEMVQRWASVIPGADLRQSVLGNPRLEQRIVARIMDNIPAPDWDDLEQSPDVAVISALLEVGSDPLAIAVATAWHRATVIEWITWNALKDRLSSITMEEARVYVTAPSQETMLLLQGAKSNADSLTDEKLLSDGQKLLGMWASEIDMDLSDRLRLFIRFESHLANPVASALVRDVAPVVLAKIGGATP